jgi:hypothetical protein
MGKGLWNNKFDSLHMYPGDTIVVPEKNFKPSSMRAVLEWSQLISNFAMSAAVIGILQ